jgi:1,4-alpha-glucan branching enzyme
VSRSEPAEPVGTVCIVLHTHLPWLAHAGAWPVGEEWLHQAWSASYRPVVAVLERLASEGRRDLVTLGVTPVLAAMLDDPYLLRETETWLGTWQVRAEDLAVRREPELRALASEEFRAATAALGDFESRWRSGASPVLRGLADTGAVELLGGPATHPFTPLLDERIARAQLSTGLDDAAIRVGRRPAGIWAPECGYRPGLEELWAEGGVSRLLVDGPTLAAGLPGRAEPTADPWLLGDSDVVAFARDLATAYLVWSPTAGYPGGPDYRDFHTFDHASGFHPARVTSPDTPPEEKAPYDPAAGRAAALADADHFVAAVRRRLLELRQARDGAPGLVVLAWDTELFGHWWHEGPVFLEAVLRGLPAAGARVTTLAGALEAGCAPAGRASLPAGSWGAGKDWHIWDGEPVADLAADSARVQARLLELVDARPPGPGRDRALDQLAQEAFLVTSSDWAFMVSHDSAADWARSRAATHAERFDRLADLVAAGSAEAGPLTEHLRGLDGPFGHLDARHLDTRSPYRR